MGKISESVRADQSLGCCGTNTDGDESVPAAKLPVTGDKSLPGRERLAIVFVRDRDLCQAPTKLRWRIRLVSASGDVPAGSAGSLGRISLPCQRRGSSPPIAPSASSPSAAASACSYPGSALRLAIAAPPPCCRARESASCSDLAADSAARAEASWLSASSRDSAALVRPFSASTRPGFGRGQCPRPPRSRSLPPRRGRATVRCSHPVPSVVLKASGAPAGTGRAALGQLRHLLPRRAVRHALPPAVQPGRRGWLRRHAMISSRQYWSSVAIRAARASESLSSSRWAIVARSCSSSRVARAASPRQRFLTPHVSCKRRIESVQFSKSAGYRIPPSPRRGQLMSQGMALFAKFGQCIAPSRRARH